jgi:hypothetical protein
MMKSTALAIFLVLVAAFPASSQPTAFQDSLLDHLTGVWVMHGTIAGKPTTHDVTAEWVLAHQYLQIHEISREIKEGTEGKYEATVFIGWDAPSMQYACLWLDVTGGGGLSGNAIGHGRREGDKIPFIFAGDDGSRFHTTFAWDRTTDSWQWIMDGEENGKLHPFARLILVRQRTQDGERK